MFSSFPAFGLRFGVGNVLGSADLPMPAGVEMVVGMGLKNQEKCQNNSSSSSFQLKTNHSVWEQLQLTKAMVMGEAAVVEIDNFPRAIILIYLVIAFSPFGYYLAIHIVAEKERKLKEFLKILGLHDTAFWYVSVRCNLLFIKGKRKKVHVKKAQNNSSGVRN